MAQVETVTVLITDLVGSTALESSLGPVAAEELRQEHFTLLRDAIDEAEGREVKNTGDGIMAVFPSASSAVGGAIGMQQRIVHRNRAAEAQLGIRIGISMGDATAEAGDFFGTPVIEAARLCDKATGGQILVHEMVKMMARGREGAAFESVGALELKGLPEPVPTQEVRWEPLAAEALGMPLPQRLRGVPPVGYVGRIAEREQLERLWTEAKSGERRLALLSGEPGIGKTRLATHTALEAHAADAFVLYGRSNEELAVPYEPWVEAVRHYVEHAPEEVLRAHVESHGGDLARLAPELGRRIEGVPAPRETDPETERYMLWGAVVGLLEEASRVKPIIFIVDDLHWADKPSLGLLKHLVTTSASLHLLLVGTYRESDLTRGHPLTELLADLRREEGVERISLTGLEQPDVIALMEAAAGHEMDEMGLALGREILAETDGNPFYVAEVLRHLVESGALYQQEDGRWALKGSLADLGLPQSVREVIGRRVERLGEETVKTLSVGAVIGRDFDLDLLARVSERSEDDLLDTLDEAVEAAVLQESTDEPGRYSFAHALVNHTLYEGLGTTRRARLHRRVAEAIEDVCGDNPGARLGELANHWSRATTAVDAEKAISYSRRAGERALGELAPDEALRWFTQALELHAHQEDGDAGERCDILIGLGDAQKQSGEGAFRETLLEASGIARTLADADRLTRAVVANNRGQSSAFGLVDDERIEMLEGALELVEESDKVSRARLLALLALELNFGSEQERRQALSDEALALARETGDKRVLAQVLSDRHFAISTPSNRDERQRNVEELLRLAEELDDPVFTYWGSYEGSIVFMEGADLERGDGHLARMTELAEELGQPAIQWNSLFSRATRARLAGRLDESEELAEAAAATEEPDALLMYTGQVGYVRYDQGGMEEFLELFEQTAEDNPAIPAFRAGLGVAYTQSDRLDDARTLIEDAGRNGFADVPLDQVWMTTMALFAEVAARARATRPATSLYELMLPYEDMVAWVGVVSSGSFADPLGRLAATLGRHGDADRHFAKAAEVNERLGAPVYLARTRIGWAESLLARGGPGDADRARELLEQALLVAKDHGCAELERWAEELLAGATSAPAR